MLKWAVIIATFLARFIVEAWKASVRERDIQEQGRKEVADAQGKDQLETRLKAAAARERLRTDPDYAAGVQRRFEESDDTSASGPGGDSR